MKGIVFCEFCRMVEGAFSPDLVDQLVEAADLPSGGAYTAVGTYHHGELLALVQGLSGHAGQPVEALVRAFGHHLMPVFAEKFPDFFKVPDAFTFLESIDRTIHVEVHKLYPDSELPRFECERQPDGSLVLRYSSARPFAALAHGLVEAALAHFGETGTVRRDALSEDWTRATFTISHA